MWVNIPYFNPMGMQTLCLLIIYIYICTIFKVFLIVQIAEMDELSQILHEDLPNKKQEDLAKLNTFRVFRNDGGWRDLRSYLPNQLESCDISPISYQQTFLKQILVLFG